MPLAASSNVVCLSTVPCRAWSVAMKSIMPYTVVAAGDRFVCERPATRIGGLFFLFSGNRSTRRWLKTGGSERDSALATLSVARYSSAVSYRFEWDPARARSNLREHTVSFDEASTVFGDPLSLLMPDPDHSRGEERYLVLGMSFHRRLLVVSHLERPPLTRLISARPATRSERRRDEQGML